MAILPSLENLRAVLQKVIFVPIVYGFISLLPMFLSGWENSDRLTDRLFSVIRSRENTFDFVVVGGGTAGALVANRLAEHYKVLLLEAGGTPSPFQTIPALNLKFLNTPQTDWSHKTVPQRNACLNSVNQQSSWSAGRGLGGTTNINFMLHTRGHPMDFENWAQITGDPSWGYAGVLPYFKRSETFSGTSNDPEARGHAGELRIRKPPYIGLSENWVRAGQELGYPFVDLNGRHEEGFGILQYPIYKGIRQSTYTTFLLPMHKSPRLTIRRYALVRKVLFRDMNNQAYGVEYVRYGRVETAVATKEVILSAGTLGSSKLLMLSGIGKKAHLEELGIPVRSDLRVGDNLQDHLGVHLGPFFIREPKSFLFDRDITPENIVRWLFLGTGPITTTGYQGAASIASSVAKSRGEGNWPDLHLILHGQAIHKGYADAFAYAYGLQEDELTQYYSNAFGRDSFHITVVGARPTSHGQVLLSGSSISDPLVINPRYLEGPANHDYKILLEGVKTALNIANSSVFRRIGTELSTTKLPGCDDFFHGSDEYWECYIRRYTLSMHNPVGTASLGDVVDSYLRVRGTRALRVIDASIQPTIVGVGTAASTFMIGEKGVDMILKDHGIPDRDTDLFDVIFGKNGFFRKNPILKILQREFDTLNPLRALFKPFTSTQNKEVDARERFTRNSIVNNPILQVISSLFGNTNIRGADAGAVSARESANINYFTDAPSIFDHRFGRPSDGGSVNVISKNQWVLQTAGTRRYPTPRPLGILTGPNKIVPVGMSEYERLGIPEMPTVKGKGGRRFALLKALLREADLNASIANLNPMSHPHSSPPKSSVVEVVKFEKYQNSDNEISVDDKPSKTGELVAKPVSANNLGVLSINTLPSTSADQFKNNHNIESGDGKPNPFNDLIKHLKTFENFILQLTAKDRPRSWSTVNHPPSSAEIPFRVSPSNNPFHTGSSSNNNSPFDTSSSTHIFSNFLSQFATNKNVSHGPIDIGFGTSTVNGTTRSPFSFLFNGFTSSTTTPSPPVTPTSLAKNTTSSTSRNNSELGLDNSARTTSGTNIFSSWFNPQPKSPSNTSSSSWFKPFDTNPPPPSTASSWFQPFNFSDRPSPLFKPLTDMASWFKPLSQTQTQAEKSSPSTSLSSWFKPAHFDSETKSAVSLTTPSSIPPTSDPFADVFELLFGGLKKHERRAIYKTIENVADAGQNIVDIFGAGAGVANPSRNTEDDKNMKNFFELISTGTSNSHQIKPPAGKTTAESYKDFMQSIVAVNEFFNQYTSTTTTTTTTPKPHPIIAYLNTFDYPPKGTPATPLASSSNSSSNSAISMKSLIDSLEAQG